MDVVSDNTILVSLVPDFLKEYGDAGEWSSEVTFFFKTLKNYMEETLFEDEYKYNASAFPKAPNYLTRELHSCESALASKGVRFEIKKNSKGNSEIHLSIIIRTPIFIGRTPIIAKEA